jgi:hypothetical protein
MGRALFHLLNLAREKRLFVLLSTRETPTALSVRCRFQVAAECVAGGAYRRPDDAHSRP